MHKRHKDADFTGAAQIGADLTLVMGES